MTSRQLTLQEINALDRMEFVSALATLFEGPPWIVEEAWYARPFTSLEALHHVLRDMMYRAPIERQVALLRAHPDLVGRAALAGTLSPASTSEQASAGLDRLSSAEIATFTDLNRTYHDRFDFPFVICARANKKESILAGFAARLPNTRDQEIKTALDEVAKICSFRLYDLVRVDEAAEKGTVMSYEISYGKAQVPVYRVYAQPLTGIHPIPESAFTGRENVLFALEVDVEVFGNNFLPSYTHGDNSNVVATDSMKNFILRQALAYEGSTLEGFLDLLGRRFLTTYASMQSLRISARELPFTPVQVPQENAFGASSVLLSRSHSDYAVAEMDFAREGDMPVVTTHRCGRLNLELFKITGSSFTHFVRDEYTTLPERRDRPLFIYMDVYWKYGDISSLLSDDHAHYVAAEQIRDFIQTVFHEFVSESIQHLVYEIGQRLLARFPQLIEISFEAQNRTRDPIAASQTDEKVRVYSDPFPAYGLIKLTITRS